MHGAGPTALLAEVAIPDAWQFFTFAAPFLAVFALRWIVLRIDVVIHRIFPQWEWERRLGWLNIRVERQANAILRWFGYLVYAVLAASLYAILWAAPVLAQRDNWNDPAVALDLATKLPVLLVSAGFWLLYFGFELIPKLRKQYEADELEKFRAELAEREQDQRSRHRPGSRLNPTHQKSGTGLPQHRNQPRR